MEQIFKNAVHNVTMLFINKIKHSIIMFRAKTVSTVICKRSNSLAQSTTQTKVAHIGIHFIEIVLTFSGDWVGKTDCKLKTCKQIDNQHVVTSSFIQKNTTERLFSQNRHNKICTYKLSAATLVDPQFWISCLDPAQA